MFIMLDNIIICTFVAFKNFILTALPYNTALKGLAIFPVLMLRYNVNTRANCVEIGWLEVT